MNIILDVDGTLVEETGDITYTPRLRPGIKDFLQECFSTFERVSIWSAGSPAWIKPILSRLPMGDEKFDFVWMNRKISQHPYRRTQFKKLKKVCKTFPDYTRNNTLIVDDTPMTYSRNYGNAIGIPSYSGDEKDNEFSRIIKLFSVIQKDFKESGTVRHTHKGSIPWYDMFSDNDRDYISW